MILRASGERLSADQAAAFPPAAQFGFDLPLRADPVLTQDDIGLSATWSPPPSTPVVSQAHSSL